MKKLKKSLALLLTAVLVLGMLTACGSKKDQPAAKDGETNTDQDAGGKDNGGDKADTPETAGNEKVTLRVVTTMGGTDPNASKYQELVKEFEAANPNIRIQDESAVANEEWKAQIIADFSLNNEPDVIQFFTEATANDLVKMGKFVTLEEMRAYNPEIAGDTSDGALQATKSLVDGVNYAVPTTGIWEALFCNTDLFEKYNLELPTDWDKLETAIKTFKENGIVPIAISLNQIPHYLIEHLMMTASTRDEYTQIPDTAPATWTAGLDMVKTLRDMGAFPVDTDTIDNETAEALFKDKGAAMIVNGSWFANGIEATDTTAVMAFPTIPGGHKEDGMGIAGFTSGFYITKQAWDNPAKREAAVKFVLANTSNDQILKYWGGNGVCSVPVPDGYVDGLGLNPLQAKGTEFAASITKPVCPTDARIAGEPWQTLINSIVGISTGDKSSADSINEMLTIYKENQQ